LGGGVRWRPGQERFNADEFLRVIHERFKGVSVIGAFSVALAESIGQAFDPFLSPTRELTGRLVWVAPRIPSPMRDISANADMTEKWFDLLLNDYGSPRFHGGDPAG
jgi:hypothetical protein